jgi:hypothetical protein
MRRKGGVTEEGMHCGCQTTIPQRKFYILKIKDFALPHPPVEIRGYDKLENGCTISQKLWPSAPISGMKQRDADLIFEECDG